MCEAAIRGDSSKIDMSVGDIYGGSYEGLNLPGSMIASSFGKLKDANPDEIKIGETITKNDIARSLLTLVFVN